MLRSINELKGHPIAASDGDIGQVKTFYFDDERWTVRYLVVDTGGWLRGRQVLISPIAIGQPDWLNLKLAVHLTREQIEHSPNINTDKPVSRQHELAFYGYYGWPSYWGGMYAWGGSMYPLAVAGAQGTVSTAVAEQEPADVHLRSTDEVIGYHLQATDDEIGHVKDFLVDDETWQLRYLVVDTSNWWFGKAVLLPPAWIDHVSWSDQKVSVKLDRETVKGSPQWDPSIALDRTYEERLYDYYGRPPYWR